MAHYTNTYNHPCMVAIVFEFSRVYFHAVLARLRALKSSLGAPATIPPCL